MKDAACYRCKHLDIDTPLDITIHEGETIRDVFYRISNTLCKFKKKQDNSCEDYIEGED